MPDLISTQCPKCKATLKLKNRKAIGKKVTCPKCKQPFVVKPLPEPDDDDDFLSNVDSLDEDYAAPEAAKLVALTCRWLVNTRWGRELSDDAA